MTKVVEEKKCLLAEFLNINVKDIKKTSWNTFETTDGEEYFVLTDEEANAKAYEEIKNSLWAFKTDFIIEMCGFICDSKPLSVMQENACENCNELIKAMIEGTCTLDTFVQSAIEADGRGHFIATYDGEENIIGDYCVYRIN